MSVQQRSWFRKVLRSYWGRIGVALFLIACIQVGPSATIMFQYFREQLVIRQIESVGGKVICQSIAPKRQFHYLVDPLEWTPFYQRARTVMLIDCDLPPDLCASLVRLKYLDWLCLEGTGVGDEEMKQVQRLPSLTILDLDRTNVTDQGVQSLVPLANLQQLFLCETSVSDASVESLIAHPSLISLWIENTAVSAKGLNSLRRELSGCQIKPSPTPIYVLP